MKKLPTKNDLWLAAIAPTPLGPITCALTGTGLAAVYFAGKTEVTQQLEGSAPAPDDDVSVQLCAAREQIAAYLRGELTHFDLPIDWRRCSVFQRQVLEVVTTISYGQVMTYAQIAAALGNPKAVRAVGGAVARNPIPLVVPCHRVISQQGKMRGYSGRGGIKTKAWLLQMEGQLLVS